MKHTCKDCRYKRLGKKEFDQHCYMFKENPTQAGSNKICGYFVQDGK